MALTFVLLASICMSLISTTALSKVKDTSAEVSTAEYGIPQYPKEEVDGAVYAPPQGSKNKGTAKDPTVKTTTESKDGATTTETTWFGSSASNDDNVTEVKGEDKTTKTTVTKPDGSGTKTETDQGAETITSTTGSESAETSDGSTVINVKKNSFTTDTDWQNGYVDGDGEHLSGDKIDVKLADAYDAVTITVKPKGAAEQGDSNTETVTQYTTREAVEKWIRKNHPDVLDDPNAEVIVEPAYKTEWRQTGFSGYWARVLDDEGNPIPLRDSAGNPLIESFYIRTSKTYEDNEVKDYSSSYGDTKEERHTTATKENPTTVTTVAIELPEGYVPGQKQETNNGLTTLTKVEVITDTVLESDTYNQAIGYKITKTVTDSSGKKLSSRTYSKYGARVETETAVTPAADADTDVTTTTVTTTTKYMYYTRKNVESGTKADASRNVSLTVGKVALGKDHNKIDSSMLQPDSSLLDLDSPDRHLINGKDAWTQELLDPDTRTGAFRYEGYGLRSSAYAWIKENSSNKRYARATQFKITAANGQTIYVYCCDKGTQAHANTNYDMTRLEDSGYIANEDAIKHIEAIASNGFWGTVGTDTAGSPKAGSLAAMRSMLENAKASSSESIPTSVKSLTDTQIAALDEGLALTATQAALWVYGHHEENMMVGSASGYPSVYEDLYDEKRGWIEPDSQSIIQQLDADEKEVVKALYKLLISDYMVQQQAAETTPTQTSKIIRSEDIKNAAITVKDRLKNNEDGKAVYNADLTFTLDLDTSDDTNDLTVQVMNVTDPDHPVVLSQKRIAGGEEEEKGNALVGTDESGNTTCTFRDLSLANDTKLRFVLTGTQALQPGAYLYQSITGNYSDSQTFVGLTTSHGTRSVDLQMDMSFSVTDAFMQDYEKIQSEYRTVTGGTRQTDITIDGKAQISTRTTTEDRIEKTWESSWQETFGPGHDSGNVDDGTHTSAAPKTGDVSLIWYALCAFSSIGLAGIAAYNKKHRARKN